MSGLFDPFLPKSVHTLAFASSTLAKVARDMASGQIHDHLLLHGDPGCGKSHLAALIVSNRYPTLSLKERSYEGATWTASALSRIESEIDWGGTSGLAEHYTIINEVDQISNRGREELKAFMDNFTSMKFVMTTNDPMKLSGAFRNRGNPFRMDMMPVSNAVPIVQEAATSLGKSASDAVATKCIEASNGSWRTLERHVRNLP